MQRHTHPVLSPEAPTAPETAAAEAEAAAGVRTYGGGLGLIRAQLDALMARASIDRTERLFDAVLDGEIDGRRYRGHTQCPLAWLGITPGSLPSDDTYLAEGFVFPVMPGETPQTNGRLRRIERWVALFLAQQYDEERIAADARTEAEAEARA